MGVYDRNPDEYMVWLTAIARCYNPTSPRFPRYGGRGIRVCARWLASFAAFLADMGPRPSSKHSIDRIDNDGNYEPGNCRWATREQQAATASGTRVTPTLRALAKRSYAAGMRQVDIAKAIGVAQSTISLWVRRP